MIIIACMSSGLYSSTEQHQPVYAAQPITFAVETQARVGFSSSKITSILPSVSNLSGEVPFRYDQSSSSYMLDNIYYYVQTFSSDSLKFSLSFSDFSGGGETLSIDSFNVSVTSPEGNIQRTSSGNTKVEFSEVNDSSDFRSYPRYYSADIILSIPFSSIKDFSKTYKGTITLEVISN